jgi:hypothetical protein
MKNKPATSSSSVSAPVSSHQTSQTSQTNSQEGEKRRFKEVWLVEDRREGKSMWTRVGTAFENADGSWNIRLSAMPVAGGRLNMRDPVARDDAKVAA